MNYLLCKEKVKIEGHTVFTYGIKAYDEENNLLQHIPDLSLNKLFVSEFVDRLNHNKVELVHLQDVIDDFFSEYC